ncbi:hypothetical protein FRB94_008683 [Tulasnella sp. JGI-2019a]|nr:hypothetical protein FRB94_008683 [Tulasnella sp. JGI-2019a]
MLRPVVIALLLARSALSAVTVYTAAATSTGPAPTYSNPSIDQSVLQPPSPPTNQNQAIAVQVPDGGIPGMSNPVVSCGVGCPTPPHQPHQPRGFRRSLFSSTSFFSYVRFLGWILLGMVYRIVHCKCPQ